MNYFDAKEAAAQRCGDSIEEVLALLAGRYMGENPAQEFLFYPYHTDGFTSLPDGRYRFDLNEKFPDSRMNEYVWIKAVFYKEAPVRDRVLINCLGPVAIWLNGTLMFQSTVREEVNHTVQVERFLDCKKGWNELQIRCQKTASGFGCVYGSALPKWRWQNYFSDHTAGRERLGFAYTAPRAESVVPDGVCWYPATAWSAEQQRKSPLERIFGVCGGRYLYALSNVRVLEAVAGAVLESCCASVLFVDGVACGQAAPGEPLRVSLAPGRHQLLVRCLVPETAEGRPDFSLHLSENAALAAPEHFIGLPTPWIYTGPLDLPDAALEQAKQPSLLPGEGEDGDLKAVCPWYADEPNTVLRPVLENALFARWNYPIGVTLYGFIKTARFLKDGQLYRYAYRHIAACVRFYRYSLWEKQRYGYPFVNIQIANMSMLDDCGSFGNAMLELDRAEQNGEGARLHGALGKERELLKQETARVADDIAAYMEEQQERRPDGAFYRICKGNFMENTLWADDLYMSVPFLTRYYRKTGDERYLRDAANQFRQFKKYLYMEDKQIMSHVYDFKYSTATYVPWGRGNGWVLFSLAELLAVMDAGDQDYAFLLEFYRELAEGYIALQTKDGMWHQVLTDPRSYPESSCTSMFVYALCCGLQRGWLEGGQQERAYRAVELGWNGLTRSCIDYKGNVFGISDGSDYSFKESYYRDELPWVINDPHGIGIAMLAGIELLKLRSAAV